MKYTVVWLPDAEAELALWYNAAIDKQLITSSANVLDDVLARFPEIVGESRFGDIRIAFEKPLGIYFRIAADDYKVEVIHVWRY